jgi:hypothetical protein
MIPENRWLRFGIVLLLPAIGQIFIVNATLTRRIHGPLRPEMTVEVASNKIMLGFGA